MKKYQIIVIDPPWQIEKIRKRVRPNQVKMDYSMMSIEQIKQLPIDKIADDICTLFLWTIDKYLFDSKAILESWGFKYHLTMTWDKKNGQALYGFNRQTEFILVGLKGKHEAYPKRQTIRTSFSCRSHSDTLSTTKTKHSVKPTMFYTMLDVLKGNRIDIFARSRRLGWDVWGNEVESDIDLTTK